jgi:hypothetical protein
MGLIGSPTECPPQIADHRSTEQSPVYLDTDLATWKLSSADHASLQLDLTYPIQFPMRRYLRCELLHSADLGTWAPLTTNQWALGNQDFNFTHAGGGNNSKGFYMIRPSLLPAP